MGYRTLIAIFAVFLTCLVSVVFSAHYLSTSPYAENGQLEFSLRLYKAIANAIEGNIAVSTIDVFLGLLRLYYGSLPPTSVTLAYTLGVSRTIAPETAYHALIEKVERARCGKSNFREFMLYQDELQLNITYEQTILRIYNKSETILQFSTQDDVLQIIQKFHESRSISPRLEQDEFGEINSVVLAGGGLWKEDFPLETERRNMCTYHDVFYVTKGWTEPKVKYTCMLVSVTNGILKDINATYIELNWAKKPSNISTYIIFPNKKTDLELVERGMTSKMIRAMIDNKYKGLIRLSVPEINLESKLWLKSILEDEKMQINNVFSCETNFSGLADPPPEQADELLNTVTLRAFFANDTVPQCPGNREPAVESKASIPNFRMDHPSIIVLVHKGDPANNINAFVLGMARLKYIAS